MTPNVNPPILIIEDSAEDIEIMRYIFHELKLPFAFHNSFNMEEAVSYLSGLAMEELPKIILLDLNLPGVGGRELLLHLKGNDLWRMIPTIIFSTSSNPKDIQWCYANGANSYIVKPTGLGGFLKTVKSFAEYWMDIVVVGHTD